MMGVVCGANLAIAQPFIEHWHYSGCVPAGKNIFFAWYIPTERDEVADTLLGETLYAVADYGIGVNPYQADYLAQQTGLAISDINLVELKRLCRIEPRAKDYPLTAFLSRCHKLLKQKGFAYVVAFSDPYHGHTGGIYRAANFQHLSTTRAEYHVRDANGEIQHRRIPYHLSKREGISIAEARTALGMQSIEMPPKDRWFIRL